MKITIETIGDNLSVNIKSPEGTSRADIASVMSLALASTVASVIPADAPSAARVKAASFLADMIATAVKLNFFGSRYRQDWKDFRLYRQGGGFPLQADGLMTGQKERARPC